MEAVEDLPSDKDVEHQFIQAVREHWDAMFRLARSILRNDWDAEDAVSDAIENAWKALATLRDWQAMRPWLLRITYRCSLSIHRKRKQELPQEQEAIAALVKSKEEGTPLWMYLEALPPKGRVVMQLRYAEGPPLNEIATVLRLPRGTVSARICRATRQLKEMLENEEQCHG